MKSLCLRRVIAASIAVFATPASVLADCRSGGTTTLGAECANGWTPTGLARFLPWTDGEDRSTARRQTIPRAQCTRVRVRRVIASDRLALVSCDEGGFSGQTYVGIDQLSCSPRSIALGPHRETALDEQAGGVCLRPESHPLDAAARALLRDQVPSITSEQARRIVTEAETIACETKARADLDTIRLAEEFTDTFSSPPTDAEHAALFDRFMDGLRRIETMYLHVTDARRFGPECDGGGSSDNAVRGQRTCRLINVALENGYRLRALIHEGDDEAARARAGRALMTELAGHQSCREESATFSGLGVRMLMFQGLPAARQRALVASGQIGFVRRSTEAGLQTLTAPAPFYELHNGYVYGGNRLTTHGNGHDCSSFVTEVAHGGENRVDAPSTATFRDIARNLAGEIPLSQVPAGWRGLRNCFRLVDIRNHEEPQPADLVVARNDSLGGAKHVVLVSEYDRARGRVRTVEAADGDVNTITPHLYRPIFEPSCGGGGPTDWATRPARPDLYVLRFRAGRPAGCPLRLPE